MAIDKISLSGAMPQLPQMPRAMATGGEEIGFADIMKRGMESVNQDLQQASTVSQEFLTQGKHELHEVIIALERADLSFRFMTQIRNKVLEAYSDIMRTQV